MRTEKEIDRKLRVNKDPHVRKALEWCKGTCEECKGRGDYGGCKKCGDVAMCDCDGSWHPLGMGCL